MAYTRGQLRDLCRRRLGDLATPYRWSDLQINQWINDAIADYSMHFLLMQQDTFITVNGQNRYVIDEVGRRLVTAAEYPYLDGGSDYENALARRPHTREDFMCLPGYYDVEYSPGNSGEIVLWLSGAVSTGECRYTYQADHAYLDDDGDFTTLPDRHLELVMLYVRWAAYQELATTESADPDPTSLVLSTLELNAYRAQRLYLAALEKAKATESHSALFGWNAPGVERVY
jgi:hypothetical protein